MLYRYSTVKIFLLAALAATTGALLAALLELGSVLLELSLGGFLLGVGELAVLVGVELLHELGLHLSLASLELSLHLGLLLLRQLGALALRALTAATGTTMPPLTELRAALLELSLSGFLLSVGELAVLVGVELLHELGLHLSLASLELSLHLGLLLLRQLGTLTLRALAALRTTLRAALGKLSLDGFLLGVGNLTVLVGIELLHELGLHLSLLLLRQLGTLHLHAAGLLGGAAGLLGALLSHEGHGGEQSDKQGLLHILLSFFV